MLYSYFERNYNIVENESIYVSPYSLFFLDQYPLNLESSNYVCDFGCGTGILGIVAAGLSKGTIVSIDNDIEALEISKKNYFVNILKKCNCLFCESSESTNYLFDTIICNPASLPDVAKVSHFCNGGVFGLDMILEVIDFATKRLSADGKLYLIVTSILPRSIAEKKILSNNLKYKVYSKRVVPFRPHYCNIKKWVDNLKETYSEMYYLEEEGQLYEELLLWEIRKGG